MKKLIGAGISIIFFAAAPAFAQQAQFVEKKGDWSIYAHDTGGKKTCFVVAQPRSMKPENVKRDPVHFYVSNWPGDNVTNEISVKMGYPLKPGIPVEIDIGGAKFQLFTKGEGAYVEKTDDEQKVVEAMKAGVTMVVQGRSTRGTLTTDEYSLNGVTDAIAASGSACQ